MMYGFTRSLKNEIVRLAPGARVNCVAPGWTRTPMAAAALADPKVVYQALATCVPLPWLDERELMRTRAARRSRRSQCPWTSPHRLQCSRRRCCLDTSRARYVRAEYALGGDTHIK
jgi:NAD(P)-dependent dehydrogenase (short-subunit alcohol dehydrogenase family)